MSKLWLHILLSRQYIESKSVLLCEDPAIYEAFTVTKGEKIPRGVDLVFCQHYNATFRELKRCLVPYVLFIGGDVWYEVEELGYSMKKEKFNRLFRDATAVICISPQIARIVTSYTGKNDNLYILPGGLWGTHYSSMGVDFDAFTKKVNYELHQPAKVIMSINFSVRRKWEGVPTFLKIIDGIPQESWTEVHCYGRAKSEGIGKKIAHWEKLYPWFKFEGVSRNWEQVIQGADLFAHPSLFDGWSRSVAEAMCCGLPILGFDIPGTSWVSPHIVRPSHTDPEGVRREYRSLMTDTNRRRALGEVLYSEAKTSSQIYRGSFVHVFNSILGRTPP
jgi:glycosyltransferase involved in cell wall biosynthesis